MIDVMPTVLEITGATYPGESIQANIPPMDGVSLVPAFAGNTILRNDPLFFDFLHGSAVRDGKWKLVRDTDVSPSWELYGMNTNRTETVNQAGTYPALVTLMDAKWRAWWKNCTGQVLAGSNYNFYTLTASSGSGSGSYFTNGQQAAISANAPATGKTFVRWTGATQYVASATASNTTVTMPASNIALTATYTTLPGWYLLTVNIGTGGGMCSNGLQTEISASSLTGRAFVQWVGDTQYVASVTAANTTVTLPAQDISLTATYTNLPGWYTLTVNSGIGSGACTNGQQVAISASNLTGKVFVQWVGDTQVVNNVTYKNALVTMSTNAVNLTATYAGYVPVAITVVNSTSGETTSSSLSISKTFTITGGSVLVVNLSYKGANGIYPAGPGPTNLYWVVGGSTQAMTQAVQAGNTASKAFGSSIYYLRGPKIGSGTISGSLPSGYGGQIISAYTLSGVDTNADPITAFGIFDDSIGAISITSSTAVGVPAGGFAALCSGSVGSTPGSGFSATTSSGTPVNWAASYVNGYWYQGYIPNLAGGNTAFTCTHSSTARVHIVAAAFTPEIILTPTVQAPTATAITTTNATLGATVVTNGGAAIDDYGVVYAATTTNPAPELGGTGVIKLQKGTNQTMGAFTIDVTGLTPGTQYTYAGYAHNSAGYGYSIYGSFNALFTTYTLTANGGIGGTVSPASTNVLSGGSATFVVTA
ncbi:MAG: hypothetical protein WCH86_07970, partial [Kiritimatiellales bacterium]